MKSRDFIRLGSIQSKIAIFSIFCIALTVVSLVVTSLSFSRGTNEYIEETATGILDGQIKARLLIWKRLGHGPAQQLPGVHGGNIELTMTCVEPLRFQQARSNHAFASHSRECAAIWVRQASKTSEAVGSSAP